MFGLEPRRKVQTSARLAFVLSNIQMRKSIRANTKRRGRPITTGRGHLIGVRLLPPLLTMLDKFIADSPGELSRPEAIREILAERLERK